jgi:SAM-dependent methyltransferase
MPQFKPMLETAAKYYADKVQQFGATPRGVDWNSEDSQILRFQALLRLLDVAAMASLNDYGCGYGALASYLRGIGSRTRYTGFDIATAMVAQARAAHPADPLSTFTSELSSVERAEYTVASGVFNVKQDHGDVAWQDYVLSNLATMDRLSRAGFAFNMLSSYSDPDKRRADLFYGSSAFFFDYCKRHFSKQVALLHDYPLFEFTIVVRKSPWPSL